MGRLGVGPRGKMCDRFRGKITGSAWECRRGAQGDWKGYMKTIILNSVGGGNIFLEALNRAEYYVTRDRKEPRIVLTL